jgi:hypothetical protein
MKKFFGILLAFVLLCGFLAVPARADVIFEPMDDFYEAHREDCVYHCRSYTANGPNGSVKVYKSPVIDQVQAELDNGQTVYISWVYTGSDGIAWGYWEEWELQKSGWIPMDYLVLIYDQISFSEEFAHRLVEEQGTLSEQYAGETVYFYEYPGSDNGWTMEISPDWLPDYYTTYVDDNGNTWGRVGYFYGHRDIWIALDNPYADYTELYPDATEPVTEASSETAEPTETTAPVEEIRPESPVNMVVLVAAVAAVVAVTIVLLVVLKRKKEE